MSDDPRPRVLLAWEGGAGRGHLTTLKTVALALGEQVICDAALCDMTHAAEIAPYCELAFPGAVLGYDRAARTAPGVPRTASWGEFMGDLGFRDPAFLRRQVEWWLHAIEARAADVLVGDYAPCALMAARIAGIPALAIGTGYGIPPLGLTHFPDFLPEYTEHIYSESAMVDAVNDALGPLGLPRLEHLPQVYHRTGELVRTLPMFDPYLAGRTAPLLPPVADVGAIGGGEGDEVFVYFSTTELERPGVMEGLKALGLPMRSYLPNAGDVVRAELAAAGMILEVAPVPVDLIAARSRLLLNSGQHGILNLGIAAGIPQVCFPQHLEQIYHARRAEAAGVARLIDSAAIADGGLPDLCRQVHDDAAMRRTTLDVARALRPFYAQDAAPMIRAAVGACLSH